MQSRPLVVLSRLAGKAMPRRLWEATLAAGLAAVERRHPELATRLEALGDHVFVIESADLPYRFVLRVGALAPRLAALAPAADIEASATIRGRLPALLDLIEGRRDGDALFFSRELEVEGSAEAIIGLRNALDGAEIDVVADTLAPLGPLAAPIRLALRLLDGVVERLGEAIGAKFEEAIRPTARRAEQLGARVTSLDERIGKIERRLRRRTRIVDAEAP